MRSAEYELIASVGMGIEFLDEVINWECYLEKGMRAIVTSVTQDLIEPGMYKMFLDFKLFDEFNKKFESYNYWDNDGRAVLNARQAGNYKEQDYYYTVPSEDVGRVYSFLNKEFVETHSSLRRLWEAGPAKDNIPYFVWVEQQAFFRLSEQDKL